MKVLIDIGHPGHVHLFRNFAHIFVQRGHQVHFTLREKEYETELLRHTGLPFTCLGKHYSSSVGKLWGLFVYNIRVLLIGIRFKPDVFLSHGSLYTLLSALILRKPNISFEDTGNHEQVRLYLPFTSAVLTSDSFPHRYGSKQVFYNGYHELAYLHPDYFQPDPHVLKELGLAEGEVYSVVRFVAWRASHDRYQSGLTADNKLEIIKHLSKHGRVFISSESSLPNSLEIYRFPLGPDRLHHALAYASLFVGEGATMASESAVLGTAAIYINTFVPGIIKDQAEKYGLISCFTAFEGVLGKIEALLNNTHLKSETKEDSKRLINCKCDVTAFLVKFIEEWPHSMTHSHS
jgi:predicted glycosyltransferase